MSLTARRTEAWVECSVSFMEILPKAKAITEKNQPTKQSSGGVIEPPEPD